MRKQLLQIVFLGIKNLDIALYTVLYDDLTKSYNRRSKEITTMCLSYAL